MTLEEAIKHCKEKSKGNCECVKEHKQLLQWLIDYKELKERNKPKIPFNIKDENIESEGGNSLYGKWITGACPKCKRDVQLGMKYCPECGQALDWRVEEW